jgi:hypothetical protein
MRRPKLPRIRRAKSSPVEPKPERPRRLARVARKLRPRRREKEPRAPRERRPLRERTPLRQIAGLPLPASLRTRTSLALLAIIAVLLAIVIVDKLGSAGSVSISGAGAGGSPLVAGFPLVATKNTTRIAAHDALAESAAVALAVFPGGAQRPKSVALADAGDWRAALVASELMSPSVRAPLILTDGHGMSSAGSAAYGRLRPSQVIRVGGTASPSAAHKVSITGANPAALAANVAAYVTSVRGTADNRAMVVNGDDPKFAMAAAGWAAKSGDPIFFVNRDSVPPETRDAIGRLQQPRIYVIGPGTEVGLPAVRALRKLGRVKRIRGADPVSVAANFAQYQDGDFGWGPILAGRGVVFANTAQPLAAPAAAALSASGTYGAMLLFDGSGPRVPPQDIAYLLNIQPGYASDPAHGVYNHAWLVGDGSLISLAAQMNIDKLLEILPVK